MILLIGIIILLIFVGINGYSSTHPEIINIVTPEETNATLCELLECEGVCHETCNSSICCNNHGDCINSMCVCNNGWYGEHCEFNNCPNIRL